jgi:hypothetical protein
MSFSLVSKAVVRGSKLRRLESLFVYADLKRGRGFGPEKEGSRESKEKQMPYER